MLDQEIQNRINLWLSSDIDDNTKKDLKTLLEKNPDQLKDAFFKKLVFGTGGIRELVGLGTNRLNQYTIQMATQGLSNYINQQNTQDKKVVIGFDSRLHSRFFAEEAAKVLAGNQIKVVLFSHLRPTPFISFACRELKCTAAIMITASHNPPEYNGYKVYWSDGGQVLPPHDKKIIEEYNNIETFDQIKKTNLSDPLIEKIDDELDEKYLERTKAVALHLKDDQSQGKNLKIIYTNLHGCGITTAPKAFVKWGFTHYETVKKQEATDGEFPFAKKPNPEEKQALQLGLDQLLDSQADILIANDPDADRMAAAINYNKQAIILTGNQIACLLAYHICQEKSQLPSNGAFIKTIVTSELFKAIVESHSQTCIEVLTGFKYIAEKIHLFEQGHNHTFVFGAEESYGYLKGDFIRDKDGTIAACLFAELALQAKLKGKTLLDLLYEIYKKYGIYREGQTSLSFDSSASGMKKMNDLMDKLRSSPPETIGSLQVVKIDDYKKRTSFNRQTGKTEKIELPESNVLTFWLSDQTKLIIRPSGTEPKIKIYGAVFEKNTDQLQVMIDKTDDRLKNILETFTHAAQE
ncbi:MAG: phospho-sugar mutase [Chlamydiota bacterium]|jgi:phosphoglucomutase/phosphomannomutase